MSKQGWDRDSCIAGARIGVEVLKKYGVSAHVLSVGFMAMNPAAYAHHKKVAPAEGAKPAKVVYCHAKGPEKPWKGHVVVVVGDQLIDLTLDQFSRPDYDLELEPMVVKVPQEFGEGKQFWVEFPNGSAIGYVGYPTDTAYEDSPSWQRTDLQKPVLVELLGELAKRFDG
jgi:hypothetical protein